MSTFIIIALVLGICGFAGWQYRVSQVKKLFEQAIEHIKNGQKNLLQGCFNRGLNISTRDENKDTLLHYAAKENSDEIIPLLLASGCYINAKNKSGKTALDDAVFYGNELSACCLIENGADFKAQDSSGDTILHRIARQSDVAFLVGLQEIQLRSYRQLFGDKCDSSFIDILKNTFKEKISRCKKANPIIADCLIKHGADYNCTNRNGLTVLDCAVQTEFSYLVKRLLEIGAEFSPSSNESICELVAIEGDCNCLKLLMDRGIRFTEASIFFASTSGNTKAVEMIVCTGDSDIDFQNQKGWTPLMQAVSSENTEMVKLLIEKGANIHLTEQYGLAALHVACATGSIELVSLLLQKGANPNQKGLGCSPLKMKFSKNQEIIKSMLAQAGAE